METELIFRLATLLLLVSFVAHRGYYTRKLGDTAEEPASERQATGMLRAANALFILALAATVLYLIYPKWMLWAALPLPTWLRWVGVGMALVGFVLLQWSQNTLGKNWSDAPRMLNDQILVIDGPYRWVRHPIYTAFLLILGSVLFITANWLIGLMWIGATSIEVISRARFEEQMMLDRFGNQYRDYIQETGRFTPRLIG